MKLKYTITFTVEETIDLADWQDRFGDETHEMSEEDLEAAQHDSIVDDPYDYIDMDSGILEVKVERIA